MNLKELGNVSELVKLTNNNEDTVTVLLSKDDCPYCVKVKNYIDTLVDVEKEVLTINLSSSEFLNYRKFLVDSKLISFVPTLIKTNDIFDADSYEVIVDDELYEDLFNGRIKR